MDKNLLLSKNLKAVQEIWLSVAFNFGKTINFQENSIRSDNSLFCLMRSPRNCLQVIKHLHIFVGINKCFEKTLTWKVLATQILQFVFGKRSWLCLAFKTWTKWKKLFCYFILAVFYWIQDKRVFNTCYRRRDLFIFWIKLCQRTMKNKHSMQQSRASKNTKIVRRTINTIAPIWRKIMLISYLFLEAQSFP